VSQETAQRYGLGEISRQQKRLITGPTRVTVYLDMDYVLLAQFARTHHTNLAHGVKSVEEFCGLPAGTPAKWDIQLDRAHEELL
jgi:hypothetical protein